MQKQKGVKMTTGMAQHLLNLDIYPTSPAKKNTGKKNLRIIHPGLQLLASDEIKRELSVVVF